MAWNVREDDIILSCSSITLVRPTLDQTRSSLASQPLWVTRNTSSCSFTTFLLLSNTLYPLKERGKNGVCFIALGSRKEVIMAALFPTQHLPVVPEAAVSGSCVADVVLLPVALSE